MKTPLRVHICVVGFEIDRISSAAIQEKADKVYLISQEENDMGRAYLEENEKKLKEKRVTVEKRFVNNISELPDLLNAIKKIIESEDKDNLIFINISSGSTLSAIAGTISSMMYDSERKITPYYVKPEKYLEGVAKRNELAPRTKGIKNITEILTFPMKLPSKELMIILKHLSDSEINKIHVTKKDLIEFSKEHEELRNIREDNRHTASKIEDINKSKKLPAHNEEAKQKAKDYAWINQNIITKLKDDWDLIKIQKVGRNTYIELNDKGRNMLKYLGEH
jgi:hypothetical protein